MNDEKKTTKWLKDTIQGYENGCEGYDSNDVYLLEGRTISKSLKGMRSKRANKSADMQSSYIIFNTHSI